MLNKIVELGISRTEALELIKVSEDIEKDYQKLVEGIPIQYLIGYVKISLMIIQTMNLIVCSRARRPFVEVMPT